MPIAVTWSPRPEPLTPGAAWAQGEAARRLARRLLAADDEALARLRGVAGSDLLLILGDEDALPWVDGIGYLGTSAEATALLLPTHLQPSVPEDLLERAVLARSQPGTSPIALLAGPTLRVATATARPLARTRLETWLERTESR